MARTGTPRVGAAICPGPASSVPSPFGRGRGRISRSSAPEGAPLLQSQSRATGGTKGPPPEPHFTIDLRGSRPKPRTQDPFFLATGRSPPRFTIRYAYPESSTDTGTNGGRTNTASSLRGRSLGRRIACATPPGRSRFRKVLTPGPSVHLPPGRSGGVTTEPPAGWGGAVRPFTVHARDKSLLFQR